LVFRLHYAQSVLISSSMAATPLEAGTFSPTTPYVDETAGFDEEFNSARDALCIQSDSPQASTQTTVTIESTYSKWTNGGSIPTPADGETADQALPDQPFAQTPDRSLLSLAVKQSVIDTTSTNDKAAPRVRGNRLPPAEDAKGSRSSKDGSKTPVAFGPTPAIAALSVVSATLVPTVPAGRPIGSSEALSAGAGPIDKITKRVSEFTDSRVDGPSGGEPSAEDPVAPAAIPNSAATSTVQDMPEAMAFAVRVQAPRTASLPSRVSAGQAVSDNPPVAGAEDTSSQTHATRQKSYADQGGSSAEDPDPKDAEKSKANSEAPAQSPSMSDGSTAISAAFENPEASSQPAAEPRQAGPQATDPTARIAEPASVSQTTPPRGPMKEISMRIEAAEGQKVDVRIVQRAGDLQIAVKSADDITTQGLRHGLADLANRLNETGYHAETWRPGQQALESTTTSSENPAHHSQSDGSQSHSGGPQQDRGQRHNNPSNRPPWIDEFESNLSGGTEQSGQFNGIVSQPTV
jgi:hypothetical protein